MSLKSPKTTNSIRYEFMIDHHSYTHNLRSCEIKASAGSGCLSPKKKKQKAQA